MEKLILEGRHVRLEPLELRHVDALTAASAVDPSLYQWSAVPVGQAAVQAYVETAMAAQMAGSAVPLAVVRRADGEVIGSTRFFDLERWPWPVDHPQARRGMPDACEIGYTWYTKAAIRTGVNTEAKLIMLTHAFEVWQMARVCLHTDERNARSRAAMERLGCRFEGILRSHRLAVDLIPRNSARYSIVAAEWPETKARIEALRAKYDG
ncbi:MAG TPA: GNAT family protein [Acidobacteriaceae bacterium]|nr:GNAT family protein [Acidobacteriaceae bacterium]